MQIEFHIILKAAVNFIDAINYLLLELCSYHTPETNIRSALSLCSSFFFSTIKRDIVKKVKRLSMLYKGQAKILETRQNTEMKNFSRIGNK